MRTLTVRGSRSTVENAQDDATKWLKHGKDCCIIRKSLLEPNRERYLAVEMNGVSFRAGCLRSARVTVRVCNCACVNQHLIDRKIKAHIWGPLFLLKHAKLKESGLQRLPKVWGAALKVSWGALLSVHCLRWVLLVGHSLSNSVCSFHLQLSAALSINYRGTLQLDISPFSLYLKQHAATSKSRGCLWCCKKERAPMIC